MDSPGVSGSSPAAQPGIRTYYIIEWRKDGRMGKSLGPFKGKAKGVA